LELRRHLSGGVQRLRAAAAEVIARVVAEPARRAHDREQRRALRAEAATFAVLSLTASAEHQESSASAASAWVSQYVLLMSRYVVAAVEKCSWACSRLSVRW